jgi:hypothetical protein
MDKQSSGVERRKDMISDSETSIEKVYEVKPCI